ncbi:MAG TPA: alcohol dehydrogenase catalytic domain-containing protein, partial [Streptosporangiaceae bacterium]
MKAIVQDTYGSADVLELRDIGTPEIAAGEVLVRVHAAGVDRGVWHLMTGLPYPVRLAGYGLRKPKTPVPGTNMAGVVEAAGHEVTRFQPGDETSDAVKLSSRSARLFGGGGEGDVLVVVLSGVQALVQAAEEAAE